MLMLNEDAPLFTLAQAYTVLLDKRAGIAKSHCLKGQGQKQKSY